jgi:cell wall-associated NlpC family hydrolase
MRKEDLVAAAMDMVGTPFHAQASTKGVGTDCIGVMKHVARSNGVLFRDRVAYSMRPDGTLKSTLENYLDLVKGEIQAGDILLMAFDGANPHHVAMYVGNGEIVHAYAQARKVVKQTYSDHWKNKVVAVYRFPGVE